MLMREVLHRTKNLLAVIQSIAAGTFRRSERSGAGGLPRAAACAGQRAWLAHRRGGRGCDAGGYRARPVGRLYRERSPSTARTFFLKPSAAQSFALVIHELATNAAKHGALSSPAGSVTIRWSIRANGGTPKLHFMWQERGGPPVAKPSHKGFGTVLLEHAIAGIDSAPQIDFAPMGLRYETETALGMLTPSEDDAELVRRR